MPDHAAVERRVRDFIAEHYAWEERWGGPHPATAAAACDASGGGLANWLAATEAETSSWLDAAREELRSLGQRHGVEGDFLVASGFAVNSPPRHHPEREHVETIRVEENGESTVETEVREENGTYAHGFEYLLQRGADGDWRIAVIDQFFRPRGQIPTTPGENTGSLPTRLPLTGDCGLNFTRAFRDGATVAIRGEPASVALARPGCLDLPSGAVVVHDPGTLAWEGETRPLNLRLPAGEGGWEVLLSTADGLVGAAMLRRAGCGEDETVAAFVPATRAGAGETEGSVPYHVSVDGGVICFVDAGGLAALGPRERERLDRRLGRALLPTAGGPYPDAVLARSRDFSSAEGGDDSTAPDVAIVRSGMGDGGYPCYWGVDTAGAPLCLVVDFLVYGCHHEREVILPLSPAHLESGGELVDPALATAGFHLHLTRTGSGTLAVTERGSRDFEVQLLDEHGRELAEPGGCQVGAAGRTDYLLGVAVNAPATHLRVRWHEWEHSLHS